MDKFKFRKAKTSDLDEVLRLNSALFSNEIDKKYDVTFNSDWTLSNEGKKYFKARINEKNGFVGVIEHNQKIIGYLCGGLKAAPLSRKLKKFAELENMFVEEKYRGAGAGSILVKEFIVWCKSNGVNRVCVRASAPNSMAIEFYRSLGFKDYKLTLENSL